MASQRRLHRPRLTSGQWIAAAVITFLVVAVFYDVFDSLKKVASAHGSTTAQLNGRLPTELTLGHATSFDLALDDTGGAAMDPACVGGNLTPEFRVTKVTFLGSPAGAWTDNRSCGDILETNSTVPVVVSVVPLHPGTYSIHLVPKVRGKTVGSGTRAEISVGG